MAAIRARRTWCTEAYSRTVCSMLIAFSPFLHFACIAALNPVSLVEVCLKAMWKHLPMYYAIESIKSIQRVCVCMHSVSVEVSANNGSPLSISNRIENLDDGYTNFPFEKLECIQSACKQRHTEWMGENGAVCSWITLLCSIAAVTVFGAYICVVRWWIATTATQHARVCVGCTICRSCATNTLAYRARLPYVPRQQCNTWTKLSVVIIVIMEQCAQVLFLWVYCIFVGIAFPFWSQMEQNEIFSFSHLTFFPFSYIHSLNK